MKLHVLGCHGGELPRHRTTCFLIDDVLAIDAGALCGTLSLEQLEAVEHIVLTHSHFDHVKDLPLMADLLVGRKPTPIQVHGSTACQKALRENLFNDVVWPDFTRLPSPGAPMVALHDFPPGSEFTAGRYALKSIPVSHPVESCGFVISRDNVSIAVSGDTGPTEQLWKTLNATVGLRAVFLECSFPNRLQALADVSGHLTPHTLRAELEKFDRRDAEVLLYHLKPGYVPELKRELAGLPVTVLELGDTFEFRVDAA